jgi:predicted lipid-binding transport protein (Tim44 family)
VYGLRAFLIVLAAVFTVSFALPSVDAEARAGRGRSMGRSFGSRQTPPPPPPQQQSTAYNQNAYPQQQPQMGNRGGFMRGIAGGLAGGFLGSMLFSSLGHASGFGGGHGGIGFLEIMLFAGLAYFGFRWWKNRQAHPAYAMARGNTSTSQFAPPLNVGGFRAPTPEGIAADAASDIFFKIQGAWTRRDLSRVQDLLGADVRDSLSQDIADLKAAGRINRLENITVRNAEVLGAWSEGGLELSSVRFTANVLDYTVDEATGRVLEGSDDQPVKFEEEWTFAKREGASAWQLVGIQQKS